MRSTDDIFLMALACTDKTNETEAIAFLQSIGAKDVKVDYREDRWWLGRYDKQQIIEKKTKEVAA